MQEREKVSKHMGDEIWTFIESEGVKLKDTARKMASEAKRQSELFKCTPCGVLIGNSLSSAEELSSYGIEKIYFIKTTEELIPENIAANLCSLISTRKPKIVLFPHTATGVEVAGRIAAELGSGFISNCVDLELQDGNVIARKYIYEGKASGYFSWVSEPPYIATMNMDSLEEIEAATNVEVKVVYREFKKSVVKSQFVKRWRVPLSELDITEARMVIGVGGGVDRKEFTSVIEQLAEMLEAVIGGTRVAVFKGLIPVDRQIGATGKFISSDIYMPMGISGSTRHTVGIKDVKHVVPINIDRNAPIFKFADLGIIGDLYDVVPCLIDRIKNIKKGG